MFFRKWRGIPAQLATIVTHQIIIQREIRTMRASTQHLAAAVQALVTSVDASIGEIKEYVEHLKTAHADGDDAAVNEAAAKITELADRLSGAVNEANTVVQADPAAGPQSDQPQS